MTNLEGLLKYRVLGPIPKGSDLRGLWLGLRNSLSNGHSGCADAAVRAPQRCSASLTCVAQHS